MNTKNLTRALLTVALATASTAAFAASPDNTVCNPCNLTYRFSLESDDANQSSYREAADPTMVVFGGEYYLFASKCGGYYHSTDLVNWDLIHTDVLPIEGYAPTVEEMDGKLYFTYSTGTYEIYVTDDPKDGSSWTKVDGAGTPSGLADPMLLFDNDRMFIYYGSSGDPTSYIQGWELDTETLTPIGDASNLLSCSMDVNGWEVPGDYNGNKSSSPWLEGAWVTVYDGKYYLQYSSPGTEMKAYNDGVYVADEPLGPYTVQRHNPFCYRPEGFIAACGHGSTFADNYGNYWHIATGTISKRHMFERRLVLYPVFFDADGEMYAYTGFGDYPMIMPDHKISSPDELSTGWMLLSYGKSVTASSALDGYPAANAVNEDIRTWWSAESAEAGEYITVDLESSCTINAIQVNFAEQDAVAWGEQSDAYQYKVEVSEDGETWTTIVDKSANTVNAPNDYIQLAEAATGRYVRLTNVKCPYGKFSVSGLRVFGNDTNKTLPEAPTFTTIIRSSDDARTVSLTWNAVDGAVGYNIRYGYAEDKMYLNYTVYGTTMLNISSLSTNETYYFTIDAFNEAGVTLGTEVVEVEAGKYFASDTNAGFFPLTQGGVNPSIAGTGTYDADTHTLITGLWGFGGWQYSGSIDLSDYDYLIIELNEQQTCGASLRIYDQSNYYADDFYSCEVGSSTSLKLELSSLTKENVSEALDPSHIYFVGFWSYGGTGISIKSVCVAKDTGDALDLTLLNPDIIGDGTYDVDTYELTTGLWGFGGWEFSPAVDWSNYTYLVVELLEEQTCGAYLRIYDQSNYYEEDYYSYEVGSSTSLKLELSSLTKENVSEALDLTSIYKLGFWSYGGSAIKLKSVYLLPGTGSDDDTTGITGIAAEGGNKLSSSDIYTLSGMKVSGKLPAGVYIIGGKKVIVR